MEKKFLKLVFHSRENRHAQIVIEEDVWRVPDLRVSSHPWRRINSRGR
jgi:hypothetical protein